MLDSGLKLAERFDAAGKGWLAEKPCVAEQAQTVFQGLGKKPRVGVYDQIRYLR